jgi:hypothetical protein
VVALPRGPTSAPSGPPVESDMPAVCRD